MTVKSLVSMLVILEVLEVQFTQFRDVPGVGEDRDSCVSKWKRFESLRNWFADSTVSSTSVITYDLSKCWRERP